MKEKRKINATFSLDPKSKDKETPGSHKTTLNLYL